MGAVGIDTQKNARNMETRYALNTSDGVRSLLEDYHTIESRRFFEGDYDASDILVDLHEAIKQSQQAKTVADRLTDRQLQAAKLYYIEGYTLKEAAKIMGIATLETVWEHAEKCCSKLATVFEKWNYHEIIISEG